MNKEESFEEWEKRCVYRHPDFPRGCVLLDDALELRAIVAEKDRVIESMSRDIAGYAQVRRGDRAKIKGLEKLLAEKDNKIESLERSNKSLGITAIEYISMEKLLAEKDKQLEEAHEVLIDAGSRSHRSEKLYHWYCKINNNAKPPTQTISMNKWLDNEDKVKDLEKLLAEKDKQLEEAREEFKRLLGDENGFNEIDEVFIYKWLEQFKESE